MTEVASKQRRPSTTSAVKSATANVIEDLQIPNSRRELQKVQLAVTINRALNLRGVTQLDRAALLGVAQPVISNLERYELATFSIDRLLRYAEHLGISVALTAMIDESQDLKK